MCAFVSARAARTQWTQNDLQETLTTARHQWNFSQNSRWINVEQPSFITISSMCDWQIVKSVPTNMQCHIRDHKTGITISNQFQSSFSFMLIISQQLLRSRLCCLSFPIHLSLSLSLSLMKLSIAAKVAFVLTQLSGLTTSLRPTPPPTKRPTPLPTPRPTPPPTPTRKPTSTPTRKPTIRPTYFPTEKPTSNWMPWTTSLPTKGTNNKADDAANNPLAKSNGVNAYCLCRLLETLNDFAVGPIKTHFILH